MPDTLIAPRGKKRFVRRKRGKFTSKQVSVGRSLAVDRRSKSKTVARKGEGDRGTSAAAGRLNAQRRVRSANDSGNEVH